MENTCTVRNRRSGIVLKQIGCQGDESIDPKTKKQHIGGMMNLALHGVSARSQNWRGLLRAVTNAIPPGGRCIVYQAVRF